MPLLPEGLIDAATLVEAPLRADTLKDDAPAAFFRRCHAAYCCYADVTPMLMPLSLPPAATRAATDTTLHLHVLRHTPRRYCRRAAIIFIADAAPRCYAPWPQRSRLAMLPPLITRSASN